MPIQNPVSIPEIKSVPKLNGIDHFHLYVKNKNNAAEWYKEILGFEAVDKFLFWNDEKGPLTIEDQSKTIHLALFTRTNQAPSTSIAFKSSGAEFLLWKEHLLQNGLKLRVADHQVTWSIYFSDPDDNNHEITSYDYKFLSTQLKN